MYVCVARSRHLVKKGAYLVVLSKGDVSTLTCISKYFNSYAATTSESAV